MSASSIKRHNHRVHSCEKDRKQELLQHLITHYAGKSILVVSAANKATTEIEDKNLTLSNDTELASMDDRQWDVLISFDLPKKPEEYISRLAHTKEMALIVIDEKEQALLYPIETLLGKNLPRETIPGFEPKKPAARAEEYKPRKAHRPTESQKRSEEEEKEKERKKQEAIRNKKTSQRNHHYDGTVRSESEKRSKGKSQIVKDSDKDRKKKKSFGKKEWDKPKKDKKSFEKKSWEKKEGGKNPWENGSSSGDYRNKKGSADTSNKPHRAPRVIKIPTDKSSKES